MEDGFGESKEQKTSDTVAWNVSLIWTEQTTSSSAH